MKIFTSTEIEELQDNKVILKKEDKTITEQFDNIIIATVAKPNAQLEEEIKEYTPNVFKIGDCNKRRVRKILDAITEGYEIGLSLETREPPKSISDFTTEEGLRGTVIGKVKSGTFEIDDIPDYLTVLVEICNENKKIQSKSRKADLNFQFKVIPGPGFWIKINNGVFTTGQGTLESNDVLIEMDKSIAAGIFTGEVNAASAYMSKQIKFIGPMRHGMKFQAWTNTVKKELGLEE